MKFSITFKTPDAARGVLEGLEHDESQDADDAAALLERFVKYGEYVTIDFDTIAKTVTVRPM